jgi:hypothetical protein
LLKRLLDEREVTILMQCTLCNEHIEDIELEFGDAVEVDDEYWHAECYAEYFDLSAEAV